MQLDFVNRVPTEFSFPCECGAALTLTLELPEKFTLNTGGISFEVPCPSCGKTAEAPGGTYKTIDGKLIRTGDQTDWRNQNPS